MYQSFIGLEIHIQLLTNTKVFCSCRASFGDEPNTNVCPICMGYPGVLPALNEEAIKKAYVVARALNCELSPLSLFARKNYFYPDLPKNYQISQFADPVGRNGHMDLEFHRERKRIGIHEVHLEEDAGKMIHVGDMSLLDYNRAGTPLLEIVTEPELEIGEEAEQFLQNFRRMVRYLAVCDGNMEEGSLRCDANVSVNIAGKGLGRKVEVKNMNSFRFVRKAISFEIVRHGEILDHGGTVLQETRLWNENRDITESMRSKEEANDYRYFPEPDLPPFKPSAEFLKDVESLLVELPQPRKVRMMKDYGLSEGQADHILEEKELADFFEATVSLGADAGQTAAWLGSDVQRLLNRAETDISHSPLTPAHLAELLKMLDAGRIHGKIAKQVLEELFESGRAPGEIIAEKGWEQITDRSEIERIIETVVSANPQAVGAITAGDSKPIGFLVGQVMQATSGRVEPHLLQRMLKERFTKRGITLLSVGGAIAARVVGGRVVTGELSDLTAMASRLGASAASDDERELLRRLKIVELSGGRRFSEEMGPEDWAAVVAAVDREITAGDPSGIVLLHGTDTLAYTASLLYWFFADAPVPIVLTASTRPGEEADENLKAALRRASVGGPCVSVVMGNRELAPVNLKFVRVAPDGFANWNLESGVFSGKGLRPASSELPDEGSLRRELTAAAEKCHVARLFPGMRDDALGEVLDGGVRFLILELYDTGTASLRETPFSIRRTLSRAREQGVRVYCTSQQEGVVDFSGYPSSHELWKEGAVPMGRLTTESAYTRLLAALTLTGSEQDAHRLMEDIDA